MMTNQTKHCDNLGSAASQDPYRYTPSVPYNGKGGAAKGGVGKAAGKGNFFPAPAAKGAAKGSPAAFSFGSGATQRLPLVDVANQVGRTKLPDFSPWQK